MWGSSTLDWWYLVIPRSDLNEILIEHRLYMYLGSCKGASLYIHMARSYASARVRLMRADLWKIRISSFEVRIRPRIEVSEANLVCWRTMLKTLCYRVRSFFVWDIAQNHLPRLSSTHFFTHSLFLLAVVVQSDVVAFFFVLWCLCWRAAYCSRFFKWSAVLVHGYNVLLHFLCFSVVILSSEQVHLLYESPQR